MSDGDTRDRHVVRLSEIGHSDMKNPVARGAGCRRTLNYCVFRSRTYNGHARSNIEIARDVGIVIGTGESYRIRSRRQVNGIRIIISVCFGDRRPQGANAVAGSCFTNAISWVSILCVGSAVNRKGCPRLSRQRLLPRCGSSTPVLPDV